MHRLTLRFFSAELEAKYQSQCMFQQPRLLSTFILFQFFFLLLIAVSTIVRNPKNIDHFTIFLSCALGLIFLWGIRFKYTKFFLIGVQAFFFLFGMVLTEFALLLKTSDSLVFNPQSVAFLIPIMSFCSLMLLVRLNWMISSFFYLFNLIYFIFRMMDIRENWKEFYIWIGLLMAVLNFGYMSFREQKIHRQLFKKNHDSLENMSFFHLLLRNVLPSSIFLLTFNHINPHIEFINSQAMKLMKKVNEDDNIPNESLFKNLCSINIQLQKDEEDKETTKKEMTFQDVRNLLSRMEILDKKFEKYQNKLPELLLNYFINKVQTDDNSPLTASNQEIHFLTLNLAMKFVHTDNNECTKPKQLKINLLAENDHILKNVENEMTNFGSEKNETKTKYYELKLAKIRWNEKDCLLVLLSDVTKSKKIIELKSLDKHKNQLLASISHDLRTPLNGVIGMVNATLNELSDDKLKDFLKIALRSANLLDFLIKDILDFSQISYKQLRLNIDDFDINSVINEVFLLMKFQARSKPISLELQDQIPEYLPCRSDPNRIKQILINLLGNAIKFTKQGFVRLKVTFSEDQTLNKRRLKFEVEDSGIGIRESDQGKLFSLFGKLKQDDPEINKYGIGLGLAISNNLAKLLDSGNPEAGLHVSSVFGKGSLFWFYVDIGHCQSPTIKRVLLSNFDSSPTIALCKSPKNDSIANVKPLVLIVDDDQVNIFVLEKYLECFEVSVLRAVNGKDAIDVVDREVIKKDSKIRLILMDCNMPLMNGLQATEAIRKLLNEAGKSGIPIIGISANDTQEEIDKCMAAGMTSFLGKPVKKQEFCIIIEKFMNQEESIIC